MDVYFVRHGVTDYNVRHIHQPPTVSLSEKGREQSATVAEYLRSMNPDLLVTSDHLRAVETAGIIGNTLDLVPVENWLFHEVGRPSDLYNRSHFHPKSIWYVISSILHRADSTWHSRDAENFADVEERVRGALKFLEACTSDHKSVVVVSHAIFINLLTAFMCKNRILDLRDLLPSLLHVSQLKNTGVMHIKYVGKTPKNTCAWQQQS